MMKILRYEDSLANIAEAEGETIFLAGPTVRGNQPWLRSWRFDAMFEFRESKFEGTIIIPEFSNPSESDKGKLWIPRWEFAGLTGCDTIMFWVPRTQELIGLTTNHEHGYWLGKCREKVVYGRPDIAYRNVYLDVMYEVDAQQRGVEAGTIYNTMEATIFQAMVHARNNKGRYRVKSKVPVDSPYGAF